MKTSEQINEIAAALSKAQGAMRPALKDAQNPHFKSKYADLAANVEAARGPLATNGLAAIQEATTVERGVSVVTMLMHSSGQWILFDPLVVPMAKVDAHGVGSATTYARRYALGAALGIVAEDDDGNAATAREDAPRASRPEPVPPTGYAAWLVEFKATAKKGLNPLRLAFKDAPTGFREYLTRYDAINYEAAKADAETASKNEAAVTA